MAVEIGEQVAPPAMGRSWQRLRGLFSRFSGSAAAKTKAGGQFAKGIPEAAATAPSQADEVARAQHDGAQSRSQENNQVALTPEEAERARRLDPDGSKREAFRKMLREGQAATQAAEKKVLDELRGEVRREKQFGSGFSPQGTKQFEAQAMAARSARGGGVRRLGRAAASRAPISAEPAVGAIALPSSEGPAPNPRSFRSARDSVVLYRQKGGLAGRAPGKAVDAASPGVVNSAERPSSAHSGISTASTAVERSASALSDVSSTSTFVDEQPPRARSPSIVDEAGLQAARVVAQPGRVQARVVDSSRGGRPISPNASVAAGAGLQVARVVAQPVRMQARVVDSSRTSRPVSPSPSVASARSTLSTAKTVVNEPRGVAGKPEGKISMLPANEDMKKQGARPSRDQLYPTRVSSLAR
jgi:hypothetical protein